MCKFYVEWKKFNVWNWLKNWKVLFYLNELFLNCKKKKYVIFY